MFHHNNNFNLINIYSAKTLMFWFAIFFFTMLPVKIFFIPFGGSANFCFTNSSTPPPPRDQLVHPLRVGAQPYRFKLPRGRPFDFCGGEGCWKILKRNITAAPKSNKRDMLVQLMCRFSAGKIICLVYQWMKKFLH